ncbi:CBS domain-containing protein [Mesobacillus persicus]|uniref:CBS domain-containing protein n=1 Tax=Mesobacillus persicus TaxID=930146 RepID=A0A1H8CTN3_9BACI|nr:DUF294 nucleotidyltransferase-like domain-containing protein [Mesobacillus persicus]SEM97688.1 CBS domain-containing protein [Mesobacillus persicus]
MANFSDYSHIRAFRDQEISHVWSSLTDLNEFHDEIIEQTVSISMKTLQQTLGPPPSSFCFFIMGSGGRSEQGIWSDQDHGIVYDETDNPRAQEYFLELGKEISEGLQVTGYKKCDGNVMASNPLWCKPIEGWHAQLTTWILDSSWESIRHLLTFIDGRALMGTESLLTRLKKAVHHSIHHEHLLPRILQNTMHIRKGIGILGQFLVESHGAFSGHLNVKETAIFPYVNAARLLAIREKILETSTLDRLKHLPDSVLPFSKRKQSIEQFQQLQNLRLTFASPLDYESGHFIAIDQLSKQQRKMVKEILKDGVHLFEYARKLVEKEDFHGHE